jgi:hypothetical protein
MLYNLDTLKSLFFLLIIFLLHLPFVNAQSNNSDKGSLLTAEEITTLLDHHNQARKELKIPALIWNPAIAAYAQEWADFLAKKKKCKLIHREELKNNPKELGENLYWVSSVENFQVVQASDAWYSERSFFKNQPFSYNMANQAGHYTQMIWSGTREMGAAKATCPSGAVIVVANYFPMGNTIGQLAY